MGKNDIDLDTFLENAKYSAKFFNLNFINCNCRKIVYRTKKIINYLNLNIKTMKNIFNDKINKSR